MEEFVDLHRSGGIHIFTCRKLFDCGIPDILKRGKVFHECSSSGRTYTVDIIEYRMYLFLRPQRSVILYSKSVHFVLHPCHEFKAFRTGIYRKFDIVKINASGPVIVILDKSADLLVYPQLLKHLKGNRI